MDLVHVRDAQEAAVVGLDRRIQLAQLAGLRACPALWLPCARAAGFAGCGCARAAREDFFLPAKRRLLAMRALSVLVLPTFSQHE
jgi:hypothetical protein